MMAGTRTLTAVERRRLADLEAEIASGLAEFVRVGRALAEVQADELYRADYLTFEAYCQERWGFSRRRGYEMIEAAAVADSMSEKFAHQLSSDHQARKLTAVPPEDRDDVFQQALTDSKRSAPALKRLGPTATEIDDAVRRYQDRPSLEEERETQARKTESNARVLSDYRSRPEYTPPASERAMDTLSQCFVALGSLDVGAAIRSKDASRRRLVIDNLPAVKAILARIEREL